MFCVGEHLIPRGDWKNSKGRVRKSRLSSDDGDTRRRETGLDMIKL